MGDRVRLNPTVEAVATVTEIEGYEINLKFDVDGEWGSGEMEVEVAPGRWVRARAPLLARARARAQERQ